jgi:uncharacterized membrane protein (DUF485 family)
MTHVAQSPTFGGITGTLEDPRSPGRPDFTAIHRSPEFGELRRRFRGFVFPVTALFFVWYLTFVLLAAYARELMSHRLFGAVNVGMTLGLLQFVSTIVITISYLRFARRSIDPRVRRLRAAAGVAER